MAVFRTIPQSPTPWWPILLCTGCLALFVVLSLAWPQQGLVREPSARPASSEGPRVTKPLVTPSNRGEIPLLLEAEGLKTGAELGVQVGAFAAHVLANWQSCSKYYLIDLWEHQANYHDLANVNNEEQEARYLQTRATLKPWENKTVFLRTYTLEAAKQILDNSLDYVYVDARHDYCGVREDLEAYWPKLKRGGILAGHDYLNARDPVLNGQDWSVCLNGTKHYGAVKGAVDEFAAQHNLTVLVTYREPDWPSWLARKP